MRGVAALFLALSVIGVTSVLGRVTYQAQIPNGAGVTRGGVSWPGIGHTASSGGGERNGFGSAFAAAGSTWTTGLCQADSDGDGFSNGVELGDPECVWTPGQTPNRTVAISHPGFSDSTPITEAAQTTSAAPAISFGTASIAAAALLFLVAA